MPFYRLAPGSLDFPPPHLAGPDGMLAIGGDFAPERLIVAYSQGIFPWMVYSGEPVWFSPDPRMVLEPKRLVVQRSLAKVIRKRPFTLTLDTAFPEVIKACADAQRPGQRGSWITKRYTRGFLSLFELGLAHSVEAWQDGELVGGLYGMALGRVFFGESMFARRPDASKVAFATFVRQLDLWGYALIDCQQVTDHLLRFGAEAWTRPVFLEALARHVAESSEDLPEPAEPMPVRLSRVGRWQFSLGEWDGRVAREGPDDG
jgi:leucyl/phenylalanyl-tRNA--protein transferase